MVGEVAEKKYPIPDWRIYKIDGIKELEETQRLLAARGLKDPWIRNEVWRYPPGHSNMYVNACRSIFKGFPLAVGALVLTIAYDYFKTKHGNDQPAHH